jgi:ribosomal protein S18 acetylase RimI-like enzyme
MLLMLPNVTIRPLATSDQEFLWEALYEALWDPPEVPRRPREAMERPYIRIYAQNWGSQPDDLGFVASDESGTPIGAIWSRLHLPPNQGGAFFNESTPQVGIAVFPAWQERRVGSQLMAHYLAAARKHYESVSLSVHPANQRAIRLYERAGFIQFAVGGGGYLNMVVHFARGLPADEVMSRVLP